MTPEELEISRIFLLKLAQQHAFERDFKDLRAGGCVSEKSKVLSLSHFLVISFVSVVGLRTLWFPLTRVTLSYCPR